MHETLQHIVGAAIVDAKFRQALLSRSAAALSGFPLTFEEREAISAIRADSMQDFAQELPGWISRDAAQHHASVAV